MVDDVNLDGEIFWSNNGSTFVIPKPEDFASLVLPIYFKHSNFYNFTRQLYNYGFERVSRDRWEFSNDNFRKGEKKLLRNIHRRINEAPTMEAARVEENVLQLPPELETNESLWKEHGSPKQRLNKMRKLYRKINMIASAALRRDDRINEGDLSPASGIFPPERDGDDNLLHESPVMIFGVPITWTNPGDRAH